MRDLEHQFEPPMRWLISRYTHVPLAAASVVVLVVVITWLLNRKSALDRENDRVVKTLVEGARDKYKDLRPLH